MAQKLSKKSKVAVKPVKTSIVKRHVSGTPKEFYSAVGRRKTAIARARIWPGKQEITVNGRPLSTYFAGDVLRKLYQSPFVATESLGHYSGSVKISGSGVISQARAFVHAISRALTKADIGYKHVLRDQGFLTRDPRMKETRKPGQGGRARAKKQSPKR